MCKRLNITFNNYSDRMKVFGLESLEYRRVKFDLVLVYKILNHLIDVDPDQFFLPSSFYSNHHLRRHNRCLTSITNPKTTTRNNFFSLRTLKLWNSLPQTVIQSESLQVFKFRLNELNLCDYHQFLFWMSWYYKHELSIRMLFYYYNILVDAPLSIGCFFHVFFF